MRQECAEPLGQFTGIDDYIEHCCLNQGLQYVDAIKATTLPESTWF